LNRTELSKEIAKKTGITQSEALKYIDVILNSITEAMENGDRVEIRGFGSFVVKDYEERKGVNPKTGEKITIPPKKLPAFKAGKDLKEKINKS
jgi:integration host factor subunit beta